MTVTRSELQAWLDTWNENHAAPSADSVVDFLGIELAPEPMLPVGQRRRSPGLDDHPPPCWCITYTDPPGPDAHAAARAFAHQETT